MSSCAASGTVPREEEVVGNRQNRRSVVLSPTEHRTQDMRLNEWSSSGMSTFHFLPAPQPVQVFDVTVMFITQEWEVGWLGHVITLHGSI